MLSILEVSTLSALALGYYFSKFDKRLISFVGDLPKSMNKNAFLFSTSGSGNYKKAHEELRTHLIAKDFVVIGEWNCKAFDTYGPLKLFGGINKGSPTNEISRMQRDSLQILIKIVFRERKKMTLLSLKSWKSPSIQRTL